MILIALLFPFLLFSQNSTSFQNITKGLSQNTITGFTQDEYGFLWVGTYYGLNRFDGSNFDNFEYTEGDSSTLKAGNIRGLAADKKGKIWFGILGKGLHSYDLHKDEFRRYYSGKHKTANIFALHITRNGEILLGTEGNGLYYFDPVTEKFHFYNDKKSKNQKVLSTSIYDIAEDSAGNFWLGTNREGAVKIDALTGVTTSFKSSKTDSLSPHAVVRVAEPSKTEILLKIPSSSVFTKTEMTCG